MVDAWQQGATLLEECDHRTHIYYLIQSIYQDKKLFYKLLHRPFMPKYTPF